MPRLRLAAGTLSAKKLPRCPQEANTEGRRWSKSLKPDTCTLPRAPAERDYDAPCKLVATFWKVLFALLPID